jgi:deoxycytidylate deaminase
MEIGCHHAEMNVICNCAASGVPTQGAWLIVTGEPCLMCAKMIHHAAITGVIIVKGGYMGKNGVDYLKENKVRIQYVNGPPDPRAQPKVPLPSFKAPRKKPSPPPKKPKVAAYVGNDGKLRCAACKQEMPFGKSHLCTNRG